MATDACQHRTGRSGQSYGRPDQTPRGGLFGLARSGSMIAGPITVQGTDPGERCAVARDRPLWRQLNAAAIAPEDRSAGSNGCVHDR